LIIFRFVSQGVFGAPLTPLVGRGSARARRVERARRLRDIGRRLKLPSRIENARFKFSVARLPRNAAQRAIAKTHTPFQSEKVENGRHHRRLSGAARARWL